MSTRETPIQITHLAPGIYRTPGGFVFAPAVIARLARLQGLDPDAAARLAGALVTAGLDAEAGISSRVLMELHRAARTVQP